MIPREQGDGGASPHFTDADTEARRSQGRYPSRPSTPRPHGHELDFHYKGSLCASPMPCQADDGVLGTAKCLPSARTPGGKEQGHVEAGVR